MARTNDFIKSVDKVIGTRIRELRLLMGLSREQVAAQIGVSHQQLQKYEKGINRISAGRLMEIARVLNQDTEYFIGDIDKRTQAMPTQGQRMCLEVSRNFMKLTPSHQLAVNALVRTLGEM